MMNIKVIIPLKDSKEYPLTFVSIPLDTQDNNESRGEVLVSTDILKWKLIMGLYEPIIPHCDKHNPEDIILDITYRQISELFDYMNKYAPDGYQFDLPSDSEWICAYNSGIIKSNNRTPRYKELTNTWESATPINSAGSGITYYTFEANETGYSRSSASETYGKWYCYVGVRPVLRKVTYSFRGILAKAVKITLNILDSMADKK